MFPLLGLALAGKLAKLLGGDIVVKIKPGDGSVFIFIARLKVQDGQ